jgi:hypothetical protein
MKVGTYLNRQGVVVEIAARTYLAAAAVAAGSLIAVVPVTSSGPAVERLFKLASADGDLAG